MNAPDPRSEVRHTLADPLAIPPRPVVQAPHAWKATTRPTHPRPTLADVAALALCVAFLAVFIWTLPTGPAPDTVAVAARTAR